MSVDAQHVSHKMRRKDPPQMWVAPANRLLAWIEEKGEEEGRFTLLPWRAPILAIALGCSSPIPSGF